MDDQKQEDNLEKKEDNDGCGWAVVIVLIVFVVIGVTKMAVSHAVRNHTKTCGVYLEDIS